MKPSSGTGVPHLRSRVMQRFSRPAFSHELAMTRALWVHSPLALSTQLTSFSDSCMVKNIRINPSILQSLWVLILSRVKRGDQCFVAMPLECGGLAGRRRRRRRGGGGWGGLWRWWIGMKQVWAHQDLSGFFRILWDFFLKF